MFEVFRGIDDNDLLFSGDLHKMSKWFGRRFLEYVIIGCAGMVFAFIWMAVAYYV